MTDTLMTFNEAIDYCDMWGGRILELRDHSVALDIGKEVYAAGIASAWLGMTDKKVEGV